MGCVWIGGRGEEIVTAGRHEKEGKGEGWARERERESRRVTRLQNFVVFYLGFNLV